MANLIPHRFTADHRKVFLSALIALGLFICPLLPCCQVAAGFGTTSEGYSYAKLEYLDIGKIGIYSTYFPPQRSWSDVNSATYSALMLGIVYQYKKFAFSTGSGFYSDWIQSGDDGAVYSKQKKLSFEAGGNAELFRWKDFAFCLEAGYLLKFNIYGGIILKFLH